MNTLQLAIALRDTLDKFIAAEEEERAVEPVEASTPAPGPVGPPTVVPITPGPAVDPAGQTPAPGPAMPAATAPATAVEPASQTPAPAVEPASQISVEDLQVLLSETAMKLGGGVKILALLRKHGVNTLTELTDEQRVLVAAEARELQPEGGA